MTNSIGQHPNFLQLKDVLTQHQVPKLPELLRVISLLLLMFWHNLGLQSMNHAVLSEFATFNYVDAVVTI